MWLTNMNVVKSQFDFPFYSIFFDVNTYNIEDFDANGIAFPATLSHAVTKRQAEYLAGRICAQAVLKTCGFDTFQVFNGEDRAPIWPDNITASISHTKGIAVAMASKDAKVKGIGIDIEYLMDKEKEIELQSYILAPDENEVFSEWASTHFHPLTIIFSAKESLYKALYPSVKTFFGFDSASLISFDNKKLTFRINQQLTFDVPKGLLIEVHYQQSANFVLTECVVLGAVI
jgi:enterobactin synthetase component D